MDNKEKRESNLEKQHSKTKKKKRFKGIIISVIVLIAMYILYWCFCFYYSQNRVKITYGKSIFSLKNNGIVVDGYFFDTGAYISKKKTKTFSSYYFLSAPISDTNSTISLNNIYSEKEPLVLGSMMFKNMCYEVLENGFEKKFEGMIGADIIKKANWEINFTNKTIESFPLDNNYNIKDAKMLIHFKHNFYSGRMFCLLTINGHEFKNVLIDTGFYGLLCMTETDCEKIGKKDILCYKNVNAMGNASTKQTVDYCYNNVNINSVEFRDKTISIANKSILGMQFFNTFKQIYIDHNKDIIYCF